MKERERKGYKWELHRLVGREGKRGGKTNLNRFPQPSCLVMLNSPFLTTFFLTHWWSTFLASLKKKKKKKLRKKPKPKERKDIRSIIATQGFHPFGILIHPLSLHISPNTRPPKSLTSFQSSLESGQNSRFFLLGNNKKVNKKERKKILSLFLLPTPPCLFDCD